MNASRANLPLGSAIVLVAALAAAFCFLVSRPASPPPAKLAAVKASAPPLPVLIDVTAYGAKCDGKTDDSSAFDAAMAVAAGVGNATVLIPGQMAVSRGWTTPAGFEGHLAVVGASQASSVVLLTDLPGYALDFELQAGWNNGAANVAEVGDLRFESNGHSAAGPVKVAYGLIPSSEGNSGSIFRDLTIEGGGWANGLYLNNAWHVRIAHVYAYGGAGTYATGSGGGSGSLISFVGQCVNDTIDGVQGDFWNSGIWIAATPGTTFQGIEIEHVNLVQARYAFNLNGAAGMDCGAVQMTNCLVDNGNVHAQAGGFGIWAANVQDLDVTNFYAVDSSASPLALLFQSCDGVVLNEGKVFCGTGPAPKGIAFVDCLGCIVSNVVFTGWTSDVAFDPHSNDNRAALCLDEGSNGYTVSNLGTGNVINP